MSPAKKKGKVALRTSRDDPDVMGKWQPEPLIRAPWRNP
jgi:hypothetical protein